MSGTLPTDREKSEAAGSTPVSGRMVAASLASELRDGVRKGGDRKRKRQQDTGLDL